MALKNYEVLSVLSKTLAALSEALKDGNIDKAEVIDVIQSTVMDLLKEFSDDD